MSSLWMSIVVFACVLGGTLRGMFLSSRLPVHHQSSRSRDIVMLAMGLVATTVAVVLGLFLSSAKNFYDTQRSEMTQLATNVILLDRALAYYGPEAAEARATLRTVLAEQIRSSQGTIKSLSTFKSGAIVGDSLFGRLQELSPKNDNQRSMKAEALSVAFQLGQTRWLMFEQDTLPVPLLLLVMLIVWLVLLFLSFATFAPRNLTVITGLFLAAFALSGAVFLILELYHPQTGLIRISDAPLRAALAQLGQ
jgi:hypothetical protein